MAAESTTVATLLVEEPSTVPPPAFYCPISLELMTDPVTLSSGITYDRPSIQGWLEAGNQTCPVTRQSLLPHIDPFLVPNLTLLRIIQAWCLSHSHPGTLFSAEPVAGPPVDQAGRTRISALCAEALVKLGLVEPSTHAQLILPLASATSLLTSLLGHFCVSSCQGDLLSERICEEAIALLSSLVLPPHNFSSISDPHVLQCLLHFLNSSARHPKSAYHSSFLLARFISQHHSPRPFLRNLPLHSLSSIVSGLALSLKLCSPPKDHVKETLFSLSLLCKSSRTAFLSLPEATFVAMAHAALDQLLHSARQGSNSDPSRISENALSLLETLASCAEGRAAIANHAFAVPTITKLLRKSTSEATMESAVVVLWKLCRYSSEERVRRQAMAACVPSKLVLLLQAKHCTSRTKAKAGLLVRLLLGEVKSRH